MEENLRSSEVDRELLLSDESDNSIVSNLFSDDTDSDPNFNPDVSTTSSNKFRYLNIDANASSSEESDVGLGSSLPVPSATRPSPNQSNAWRPNHRQVLSSDEDGENDESEWEEVNENNPPNLEQPFEFNEIPGPKHIPNGVKTPIDFFDLYFPPSFLNLIVVETNRYADQMLLTNHNISPRSRMRSWYKVTTSEIRTFIVVILNMGLIRKPSLKSYWSNTSSQATPWFGKMFSRSRFENLLTFFHLVDNEKLPKAGQPGYDPCQKFEPIVEHCNQLFPRFYQAHEQISVDESMIGTKCHTSLIQYLPNKHHHRWGVKFWVLCDSVSKYCLKLFCYKGKKSMEDRDDQKEFGLGFAVVKKLLTACNYLKRGYHVFIDNFFVSNGLAKWLFSEKTYMTGTCRRNRKDLPVGVKRKFKVGEKAYFKKKKSVVLAYREKSSQTKPVVLMSTKSKIGNENITKKSVGGPPLLKSQL